MELKDIKTLQEMGFTLAEIKAVYYTDDSAEMSVKNQLVATEPGSAAESKTANINENPEHSEESKKNDSLIASLNAKIDELKNSLFTANARTKLADTPATETVADIIASITGGIKDGK